MRRTVTGNAAANMIARAWSMGVQFLTIPLIVGLLGPKAYGLVTLYATILAVLICLDQGWSSVIVREFSRLSIVDTPQSAQEMRDLLRSVETVSLTVAAVLGALLFFLAPTIVHDWINTEGIPADEAILAVRLMAVCLVAQWTNGIYGSGYVGLHRQGALATIVILQATILTGGSVLILRFLEPRIEVFFMWQAVAWAVTNFVLRQRLLRLVSSAPGAGRFRPELLLSVRGFMLSLVAINMASAALTQLDKLIVARTASLEGLAAYSLSFSLASLMTALIAAPIGSILLPVLSRLFVGQNKKELAEEYHRWTQVIVFLVAPIGVGFFFFSQPFLEIWLKSSPKLIHQILEILPLVALGTLCNTIVTPLAILQLSAGWTRLLFFKSYISLPIYISALAFTIPKYGAVAGAWCWLLLNLAFFLVEAPLVHARLLKKELWSWWTVDTLFPSVAVALVFSLSMHWMPPTNNPWIGLLQGAVTAAVAWLVLLALLRYPREIFREFFRRLLRRSPPPKP